MWQLKYFCNRIISYIFWIVSHNIFSLTHLMQQDINKSAEQKNKLNESY